MFILIIVLLVCISFLWSLVSLTAELKKNSRTQHVAEELSKGRVIFHAEQGLQSKTIPENPEL
jgi:hypothetical protein